MEITAKLFIGPFHVFAFLVEDAEERAYLRKRLQEMGAEYQNDENRYLETVIKIE